MTRSQDQGEGLVHALERLGAEVIWAPAIRTEAIPFDAASRSLLKEPGRFEWAAFASANAVRYFFQGLSEAGMVFPQGLRVAAVGAATRRALDERKVTPVVVPPEATAASLTQHLAETAPPGALLLPRGRKGREELAAVLEARGWRVTPLYCYDTLAPDLDPAAISAIRAGLDAALFASPSAAKHLWDALGETERAVLRRALLFPIGPTTSAALKALGLRPEPPPPRQSAEALAEAVAEKLKSLRRSES